MSARSVCSGTRPSRYHSMRAISAPPRRPEQLMRMPSAPRRIADCTARFMARRNATRRSSCWAIDSATKVASELGLPDLDDVDDDVGRGNVGNFLAQLVDVGALLADHDAGTRRMDRHPALLVRTLDHDPGDGRLLQFLVQDLADFDILVQQLAVFVLAGEPTGIPRPVDAETQADWIDLLTHRILPRSLSARLDLTNHDRQLREWFKDTARAATAARGETLHDDAVADMRFRDDQIVDIEIMIVLGVGNRRFQALLDVDRDPLARKLQVGERSRSLPAADQLRHQIELLRAHPQHPGDRLGLVIREAPFALWFAHRLSPQAFLAFLSPEWPWKVRVGENSPNLCPTIS